MRIILRRRRGIRLAVSCLGALAFAGCAAADPYRRLARQLAAPLEGSSPRRVAVAPFTDLGGRASTEGRRVSENLLTHIHGLGKVEVVERALLNRVFDELRLEETGAIDPASVNELGRLLGADALVAGSIGDLDHQRLEVHARLIEVKTGRILKAARAVIPRGLTQERQQVTIVRPATIPAPGPALEGIAPDARPVGRMPTAGLSASAGAIADRLLVVGGAVPSGGATTALESYDPIRGVWQARLPAFTPRSGMGAAVIGDRFYSVGGCVGADCHTGVTGRLEVYDARSNSWLVRSPLPTPRAFPAAAAMDGKLYVAGGQPQCPPCWPSYSTLEVYEPQKDAWTASSPMPTARHAMGAAVIGGKLYVVGGADGPKGYSIGALEAYDPKTDRWKPLAPMPTPRNNPGVAAIDGKLYVFGGASAAPGRENVTHDAVEVYDPSTNAWVAKKPMPRPLFGFAVSYVNGRIFLVGGQAHLGPVLTGQMVIYDPAADTWQSQVFDQGN